MRDRRVDRCPKCGGEMRRVHYSERTVRGGVWYEVMCQQCLYRMDEFKPRRSDVSVEP